jgi:Ca2+-binding EF-hand superfamily protein
MGLIRQFSTHLLQESLQTSRLSEDKIQEIFNSIDEDKSGRLSLGEIKDLLRLIEQQTTGLNASEETLDYVSKYMLQIMDADQDGHVSNNELKRYISTYGLVANLNLERQH